MSLIIHKMMMAPCQHQDAIDGGVMHRFGKLLWAVKRAAMDVHASCLAHHRARGCVHHPLLLQVLMHRHRARGCAASTKGQAMLVHVVVCETISHFRARGCESNI